MNQPDILHILKTCKTIAVVGLSPKVHRDSYEVAEYMQSQGYRIIPINPVAAAPNSPNMTILGEKVYATLVDAAKVEKIDLVNCFRNSADIPPIAKEAVQINAKALWMQLGIENDLAKAEAVAAGLTVVENRCLLIEHRRSMHLL
jgi:predicted CoA-binding protein